jgi:hypothetical protein
MAAIESTLRPNFGTRPKRPADRLDGDLGAVSAGASAAQTVMGLTWKSDASVMPVVTSDSGLFGLDADRCGIVQPTLESSNEGLRGQTLFYWVDEPVAQFDGANPMPIAPGQRLQVYATVMAPPDGTRPGTLQGLLTIEGSDPQVTLPLEVEFVAVDPDSPIGRKWTAMGGATVFGAPVDNEHPVGDGTIQQDFGNGTLVERPDGTVVFVSTLIQASFGYITTDTWPLFEGLGLPADDTVSRPDGIVLQRYDQGLVVLRSAGTAPLIVTAPVYDCFLRSAGDLRSPTDMPMLAFPRSNPRTNDGVTVQDFDNGSIAYRADLGAHEVHGAIGGLWPSVMGDVGLPTTDETSTPDAAGRYNAFEDGAIYWTPATGAHALYGPIFEAWTALGGPNAWLGYAVGEIVEGVAPDGSTMQTCAFEFGGITWTGSGGIAYQPEERTATQAIVTGGLSGLGGNATMTLRADGTWVAQFNLYNSGYVSYDFVAQALWSAPSLAGAGSDPQTLLFCPAGGSIDAKAPLFGDDPEWGQTIAGSSNALRRWWPAFRSGNFDARIDYGPDGAIGWLVGAGGTLAGTALGVAVGLGQDAGQVFGHLGLGGSIGIVAGVVICLTTGDLLTAAIEGIEIGLATNDMIRQTALAGLLADPDYAFVDDVFQGTLPVDRIWLTNLQGASGRPFTFTAIDNNIYVNLGGDLYDAILAKDTGVYHVLVHELTHAWQIAHGDTVSFFSEGISQQLLNSFVRDVYRYGPPGPAFSAFGLEAQAALVEGWYGGIDCDYAVRRVPCSPLDPYYRYIELNIRAGRPDA